MANGQQPAYQIVLEQLLNQVMKAAIASAGAKKGFLILDKGGNWVIEAQAAVESERITILQSIPVALGFTLGTAGSALKKRE